MILISVLLISYYLLNKKYEKGYHLSQFILILLQLLLSLISNFVTLKSPMHANKILTCLSLNHSVLTQFLAINYAYLPIFA